MAISGTASDPAQIKGRTTPWGPLGLTVIAVCVLFGIWLRARGLAVEGFADDEVHKWLAANRYLHGDFGGDDVEHPMLMKSLIAATIAGARWLHLALPMEALTRFPNAIAGGLTPVAVALLGRRLFGRTTGLLAAALTAFSTTAIGYHRIAKEDVLLTLFFSVSMWCLAEARAAAEGAHLSEQRRWELWSAAALGVAFASKYFLFYFPIPVLAYLWLRPQSSWRVPFTRWLALIALAAAVFLTLTWTAILPSTWDYFSHLVIKGDHVGGDRGVSESILFMGRLYGNLGPFNGDHPPFWFFPVFAIVKFTPLTAFFGAAGVAWALWRRAPAHRLLLPWFAIFLAFSIIAGAKYARFFAFVVPPFLILAADAALRALTSLARLASRLAPCPSPRLIAAVAALALALPEVVTALHHAPHYRLYVNSVAGGDAQVDWYFPHCDYWDTGVREALRWLAAHAEPGAEIASEVDWTVRLYMPLFGRPDLVSRPILPAYGCRGDLPCYVIVQPGRHYRHNQAALAALARDPPAHEEHVASASGIPHLVTQVFRLAPGAPLFPPTSGRAR